MNDCWMVHMYQEVLGHFGLRQNPFALSPNSKSFHSTSGHDEALLHLVFGVETRQGLMVLTGEPGSGKTTILRYFLEWLQQKHGCSTACLIPRTCCDSSSGISEYHVMPGPRASC